MNLNITGWKPFKVGKLFTILNGKGITKEEIFDNQGDFIAVQSGEENNGVIGYIDLNYCKEMGYTYSQKPCLTVARSGSAGFVSFQKNGCVVGDSAKILLLPDNIATIELYIFFQSVLIANKFKYTYGRKVTEFKYLDDLIDLPIKQNLDKTPFVDEKHKYSDDGYVPDWEFMKKYIKSLRHKPLTTKNKVGLTLNLYIKKWGEFKIKNLFPVLVKGKCGNASSLVDGYGVNYIGAKFNDNGIMKSCSLKGNTEFVSKGNCIAMIGQGEGSAGYAIYLNKEFIGATSLNLGYADWINPYTALFVTTVLCKEYDKYSFGRSWTGDRLKETTIQLPINVNGNPHWEFMENYIKSLPYGDSLQ